MSGPFRKQDDPSDDVEFEEFRTWLSDRNCPACAVPLYSGRRRKVALDACGSCGGVWVDDQNAHHLLESKDPAFAIIAAAAAEGSEKRVPRGVRRCPDCREPLNEGYLSVGRINVDVCASHGTFFDPWELNAFLDGLAKGALKPAGPIGPYDRPRELETPFVALLLRVRDHIEAALSRR